MRTMNKMADSQPSLSARNVLPVENNNVCRDYVWGKCTKLQCKFQHECDLQTMLNILHFCHDYQNSTGCIRQNCTFLHATREEEKLFREEGHFPSDLVKRQTHAALASMSRKFDESFINRPPRPPLENQQAPPQMLMVNPMYQTAPRWFLQPPPPPPPREPSPPPPHYAGRPLQAPVSVPVYHGQSQPVLPPSAYSQPTLPRQIDTSKSPPPLLMQQVKNGSIKRLPEAHEGLLPRTGSIPFKQQPILDALSADTSKPPPLFPTQNILGKRAHSDVFDSEAGPSKRKTSNCQSSTCENCPRWELRNLLLQTKLREKLAEKACAVLKYEEKKKEIANIVELLSCVAMPQSDSSNSDSSNPLLYDTLLRALANHMTEKPNLVSIQISNSVLRRITDVFKDSEVSSSSNTNVNISQGLKRLLDLDLDLLRPEPISQPPAPAPAPHPAPNPAPHPAPQSFASVVSTHATVPPIPPQFTEAYRPIQHHAYQILGSSNSAADHMNQSGSSSAPMQHAPVVPHYTDKNNYYMMGRPPPSFE